MKLVIFVLCVFTCNCENETLFNDTYDPLQISEPSVDSPVDVKDLVQNAASKFMQDVQKATNDFMQLVQISLLDNELTDDEATDEPTLQTRNMQSDSPYSYVEVPSDIPGGTPLILVMLGDVIVDQYPKDGEPRVRTRVANGLPLKWPYGIVPYAVSDKYDFQQRQTILDSLNHISYLTQFCVVFVPRTTQPDYIYIQPTGQDVAGCSSMLGKLARGGMQVMSLDVRCLRRDVVMHETMHALGFDHTMSRLDSRKFVTVNYNNLVPGSQNAFQQKDTYNQRYTLFDYGSIMMYPADGFSANGEPTLVSNFPNLPVPPRNERNDLTASDITMVKGLYGCNNCNRSP